MSLRRRENQELFARVVYGLADEIAKLVDVVGFGDEEEAVLIQPHVAGRSALDQLVEKPSHSRMKTPVTEFVNVGGLRLT